ncbi:hypothetical protein [Polaromonas sp. YR568]|uniref:hypothetical protein n=1 Tax=Polaromonas sp. YR568 TaxID=1855301 RepID=UPI001113DEEF|nr:hypothetical protein [Polaromonas sp. YR568]
MLNHSHCLPEKGQPNVELKSGKEIQQGVCVGKNFSGSTFECRRAFIAASLTCLVGLFLMAFSPLAIAQGQGSYGDAYLGDLVRWILVIGQILVVLALFIIYKIFGVKVMAIFLVLFMAGVGYFSNKAQYEKEQREAAYKTVLANMQAECLKQGGETIHSYASGREKVFVRIHGELSLLEVQKHLVLDRSRFTPELSFLAGTPEVEMGTDALVVDVTYDRSDVLGSLPDYRWASTRINVEIRKIGDGALLAKRTDVQIQHGFCLGPDPLQGVLGFLRKVLKRSDIYAT